MRGARACGVDEKINVLGVEAFISAIKTFGFEPLRGLLTDAVKNGVSNASRSELVDGIFLSVQDHVAREWSIEQRTYIMGSLACPTEEDVLFLINIAKTNGIPLVRSLLVPQIQRLEPSTKFWMAFLPQLYDAKDVIPPKAEDVNILISELLVAALDKANPLKKVTSLLYVCEVYSHNRAVALVRLCVATGNIGSCSIIFNKIITATAASTADIQKSLATQFYLPMVPPLDQYLLSVPSISLGSEPFSTLFRAAADSILSKVVGTRHFSAAQMQTLLTAVKWGGSIAWLGGRLIPLLRGHTYTLSRDFAAAIYAQRKTISASTEVTDDLIKELTRTAIDRADLKSTAVRYSGELPSCARVALDLIKLCHGTQNAAFCKHVALVGAKEQSSTRVKSVLVPFIPVLRQYLATQGLDLTAEPYLQFFKGTVLDFVAAVVGSKPPNGGVGRQELQTFGCGCLDCNTVKKFFASSERTTTIWKAQVYRTHVEQELTKKRKSGATWTTISRRHGYSLHGLQVSPSHFHGITGRHPELGLCADY
ncbi:hypothetical protein JB92DRAFT_1116649 [Gautieria morchelliformis]|nr:hypothetical protein JB92DRAFT_1116649 [Gautieria morchelliformis]